MKTTNGKSAKNASKSNGEKTKLIVLGLLTAVLGIVLFVQFGGSSDEAVPAAATAAADTSGDDVALAASAPRTSGASAVETAEATVAEVNDRLSQPVDPDEGIERNPFANFWTKPEAAAVERVEEVKAPTVTLNATLVGGPDQPVAVIDGQLRFVGDLVGGWRLTEVASRSITLQAPTEESIEVSMPVIGGTIRIPDQGADS